jgi:L-lactate utilization protein LutB
MTENAAHVYWQTQLENTKSALEKNKFKVWIAEDQKEAQDLVLKSILPDLAPNSLSFGGSLTIKDSGLYKKLSQDYANKMDIIDTYEPTSPEETVQRRRKSLLVDVFLTGTNAITEQGFLVNLDGMGNRVAAMTFGPKNVLILAGRNKIVPDLDRAVSRIKDYAAPVNAYRLNRKTPCTQSMQCEDCQSPERICNYWSIIEKSQPQDRIQIVLINQELGF